MTMKIQLIGWDLPKNKQPKGYRRQPTIKTTPKSAEIKGDRVELSKPATA